MARVELAPGVLDDFERFLEHMARFEGRDAPARIGQIVQAIDVLTHSPLIGCPVAGGSRDRPADFVPNGDARSGSSR
jgi:toxin ParE1/3/4